MGEMRDSDWSRENLLRSDWSEPKVAPITTNMALVSFRLFRKNLSNLRDFFGQMVYRPPPRRKISRTPMIAAFPRISPFR